MSNPQCSWASQKNKMSTCNSQLQWESMRAFYSRMEHWPTQNHALTRNEGESPLVQTMLRSTSAATRLPTYAWCTQLANSTTLTEGTPDYAMPQTPLLLQATWHKRKAYAWFLQPVQPAKSPSYTRRLQASAQPSNLSLSESSKNSPEISATRRQWEDMRRFYLSINLWPSTERQNPILEGGSPLVWTMLHPPKIVERCLTYSWKGHLDNFLPWACTEQMPLISYAKWNIQQCPDGLLPLNDANKSAVKPTPQSTPDRQQLKKQQMFTATAAGPEYQLPAQQSSSSGFAEPPPLQSPAGYQHWKYHRPSDQAQQVKSRKSCSRWTTAIIQCLWNTAWDLLTHRNVEILPSRVWPAHLRIAVL